MTPFPPILESIDDLNKEQIDVLLSRAKHFKQTSSINPLKIDNKNRPYVAYLFMENSTRTKNSFWIAADQLGAVSIDLNASSTSLSKGESFEETLLTLRHQGFQLCIIRTSESSFFSQFKTNPPLKMINAGDGTNEHPTQALLDLQTLLELSPELNGKTIAIMGDIRHSRVAHSLMKLLPQYGLKIILNGPSDFLPELNEIPLGVSVESDRDTAIKKSDFLYLLRIQKERHQKLSQLTSEEFSREYHKAHGVSLKLLESLKKCIPVFHPGPANIGVEIDHALVKSPYYQGYLQVENSIPMRMAIIESVLLNNYNYGGNVNGEKS